MEREQHAKTDFRSEADLCACFIECFNADGWICYPETAGFDILAVRADTGHQLGIEAKLQLNAKVAEQIFPGARYPGDLGDPGPDWRGILVPAIYGGTGFARLLQFAGVTVFVPELEYHYRHRAAQWRSPHQSASNFPRHWHIDTAPGHYDHAWHDWNPSERCELPSMVPSVRAGVPAPIQLTPWKVGALKVLATLELAGSVTRHDVLAHGIDPRRFCASDGWLKSEGEGRWSRGRVPEFDKQHPKEYAQVLAEMRKNRDETREALFA